MADEDMEFRALGTVEVLSGGSRLSLGGPKQRGLLAMLLTNVGRVVPLDRIGEFLWPERPPSPGTIYRLASRLRQVLWPPGVEPTPERSVLVGGDGGDRLVVDPEQVDVVRFEDCCGPAEQGSRRGMRKTRSGRCGRRWRSGEDRH